jgi:hypothetical protein
LPYASPRFLPGASTLLSCLALEHQTTLSSAMRGTGVTPQAVVLSSSTNLKSCSNIESEITATAVNSVTGRWRINGGGWTTFTGLTPLAQPLAGTPYTLTFPNGTYTNLDAYRSVFATILDDKGNVFDGSSASAAVRPYVGLTNSFPTIQNDGVGTHLRTTTAGLSTALVGGIRKAFTAFLVGQYLGTLAPAASAVMFSFCDGSAGTAGFFYFAISPAGKWRVAKRGDTGGTLIVDSTQNADNNFHVFEIFHSGTQVSLLVDGVATSINNSNQNVGATVTAQFVDIGQLSTQGQVPDLFANYKHTAHALHSGVASSTVRALTRQNLKLRFGL